MYGLIAKLTTAPGKRQEMIRISKESAADMLGCLAYIVAKDSSDENILWVTEVWDNEGRCIVIFAVREKRNTASQRHSLEFRKDRCHHPGLGSRRVGLPPARVR